MQNRSNFLEKCNLLRYMSFFWALPGAHATGRVHSPYRSFIWKWLVEPFALRVIRSCEKLGVSCSKFFGCQMTLWAKISQNLWIQLTSEQFSHKLICDGSRMSYLLCPDQSWRKSMICSKLAACRRNWQNFWKSAFWWDIVQLFGPCQGLTHPEGCIRLIGVSFENDS